MPRRCRGIRGDEGIAPYGRFIEGAVVGWREGQSPAPTGNTMLYICGNYGLK